MLVCTMHYWGHIIYILCHMNLCQDILKHFYVSIRSKLSSEFTTNFYETDVTSSVLKDLIAKTYTGIPQLVRFFGPQQTALLEKPH